jgi:predicted DCC family thiol-disulfide oxidoreductase YuxK
MDAGNDVLVVAFDGDCLMCSRGMRFLAEHDRHRRLRFTPLQSPRGQRMEAAAGIASLSTVLVEADERIFKRSDAVLRLLDALGGFWRLPAALGRLLPRPLRDAAYDFVAARRHRWSGKSSACTLPSEALRERLLP